MHSRGRSLLLAGCLIITYMCPYIQAFNPRAQGHRLYEPMQSAEVSVSPRSPARMPIPSSPAVAMNLPASDEDDGSANVEASMPGTPAGAEPAEVKPTTESVPLRAQGLVIGVKGPEVTAPTSDAAVAAPAAVEQPGAGASSSQVSSQQPTPQEDNQQQHQVGQSMASMLWDPLEWSSWGQFEQFGQDIDASEPTGYRIEIHATNKHGSPQSVIISSTLNKHGLDLDWGHEDAFKLANQVSQQMSQHMLSVEQVFDNMLLEATEGVARLQNLANGGLLEWQQQLFGGFGGRRLKQSSSGQFDVLRLLREAASSSAAKGPAGSKEAAATFIAQGA